MRAAAGAVSAVSAVSALGAVAALVACGAGARWVRRSYLVTTVRGRSMEPTLRAGDRLLVRRAATARRGQVVVVEAPDPPLAEVPGTELTPAEASAPTRPDAAPPPGGRLLVKRVVAVAGDPVPRDGFPALRAVPEDVVPPGALVVLGDNLRASWDSRDYGFVTPGACVGVAVRRLTS